MLEEDEEGTEENTDISDSDSDSIQDNNSQIKKDNNYYLTLEKINVVAKT